MKKAKEIKPYFKDIDTSKFWSVYPYGLPFSEKLAENIRSLIDRVDNNKASLLIFDGGVGEGKTTLNVEVGDFTNICRGLPHIDLTNKKNPQIALGGVDFIKKMRVCYEKKLPYIVYSEAGDFSKRGSLTKFNKLLNDTFETYRAFKIVVGLDLPNMNSLDNDLFDKQIPRLLVNCHNRSKGFGNFRGYSLYRMYYVKQNMSKMVVKPMAYTRVEPNFVGHFKNLSPERAKQLDIITTTNKLDKLRKSEIEIEGLLNVNQIAIRLMRSVSWVRFAIKTLKITPKRTVRRVMYYEEMVVSLLGEHTEKVEKAQRQRYEEWRDRKEKEGENYDYKIPERDTQPREK